MATDRLFGTNGIRGVVNETLTPSFVMNVGLSIAKYLGNEGRVIVGTDTRTSRDMMLSAMCAGLLSGGCDVVNVGIAPTPAIQYSIPRFNGKLGVLLTASHNPPFYNGIKCSDATGTELSREEEEKIEAIYFSDSYNMVPWDRVGRIMQRDCKEMYISGIMRNVDVGAIKSAKLRVVVDCANGAASLTSPYLFERLGCEVISMNAHPQGTFPGHPSEPTPENLKDLMAAVRACSADLGIAHDGDADRVIFVDEKGEYVYGDRILALMAKEIVHEHKGGIVVTGINSSMAVEEVVREEGGRVVYTRVGSPVIARKMIELSAIFGGEENGGLMFPGHLYARDGAMTAAKVLEVLAKHKKTLSEMLGTLPKYKLYKTKVDCPHEKKAAVVSQLAEELKNKEVVTLDGVKVLLDNAWVLVRASGTEEIIRIYGEAKSLEMAKGLVEEYTARVEKIIRNT